MATATDPDRFSLIELTDLGTPSPTPTPTPKRAPTPEDLAAWHVDQIRTRSDLDSLRALGERINADDTVEGRRMASLPSAARQAVRAAYASHRDALRAHSALYSWPRIWGSLPTAIGIRQRGIEIPQGATVIGLSDGGGVIVRNPDGTRTTIHSGPSTLDRDHPDRETHRRVFGRPRAQGTRTTARQEVAVVRESLYKGEFLYGVGDGLKVDWGRSHAGGVTRARLMTALEAAGLTRYAPDPKSDAAQFGHVVGALNARGMTARSATKRDSEAKGIAWPATLKSRWIVGSIDASADLGSLGSKHLVVDLHADRSVSYTGDGSLAARVRSAFEALTRDEVYTSTDVAAWVASHLRYSFHGVEYGAGFYIPPSFVEGARAFLACVKPLMGRNVAIGKCETEAGLVESVCQGLAGECEEIAAEFIKETDRAKREGREGVGPRMVAGLIKRIEDLTARIAAFGRVFGPAGDRTLNPARDALRKLEGEVRARIDDSSERFAMLDL